MPKPSTAMAGSGSTGGGAKPESPSPAKTKSKSELSAYMEDVLRLMNQRMEGQASTVQVESAVSNLLDTMGAPRSARATASNESVDACSSSKESSKNKKPATATRSNKNTEPQPRSSIQEDLGNYDDSSDSDNDNEVQKKASATSSSLNQPKKKKRRLGGDNHNDNNSCCKQDNPNENDNKSLPVYSDFADENEYRDAISLIPMGKEAAKMMTTFGDGTRPKPDPVEMALMGTRKALQVSIMDARKVRRRLQKEYRDAQSIIASYAPNKYKHSDKSNPTVAAAAAWAAEQSTFTPTKHHGSSPKIAATATPSESHGNSDRESGDETDQNNTTISATPKGSPAITATQTPTANSIDPVLVYRALAEGTDKLSYAHKCGFHMEELTHLYPEEMRAYQRWNEMHEEYSESKADDGVDKDKTINKDGDAVSNPPKQMNGDLHSEPDGGHLRQRAANFDYRTDQMKNEWYVEYAKVRQGSFLPSGRVRRSKTEIEWDRLRKIKKGRHAAGEWENISGRAVRFLHWLGFDPPNLYPPDEDTTQALAFLAYDRFGRIIEKAIFLRNENHETAQSLWELPPGEHLSARDIERALEDPDIKPATVYGTEDSKASSVQLYFGPGWEDRLELEMEEMIGSLKGSDHQISEEERMVRNHEMELLTKISAPPGKDGIHLEILVKNHKETMMETNEKDA